MAINPATILPYFKNFCAKGSMQGPFPGSNTVINNSYTIDGIPKAKTDAISNTLTEYITAASQYYDQHQPGLKDAPPLMTQVIWEVIAHNIAYNFHWSRNGKGEFEGCTPANVTGKVDFVAGPPATVLAGPTFATMFVVPPMINGVGGGLARAKASIDKDKADEIKKTIIDWFKANYAYSIKKGKEKGITAQQLAEATAPDTEKEAKAVSKAFNDYFKKSTYSAKPGVELPPALVPKSADQEYFPDLAPHKDADGSSEGPPRAGAAGYCIGPFYRNVILEEASGKCSVKDGSITQKSPKFKVSEAPIDTVEFFIDDEPGNQENGRLRKYLGTSYNSFVQGRNKEFEGPSGLPVNGGQDIIISYKDPDTGEDKTINTQVAGLNKSGKRTPGTPAKNDNFGNPLTPEDLIAFGYGQPELDTGTEIQNWVKDNSNTANGHVLGILFDNSYDKNKAWGGPGNNKRYTKEKAEDPVLSYMSNARVALTTPAPDTGEEGLSQADPRTWGPWTEYAEETDKARRFKHLVPDPASFAAALAATPDETFNGTPGVAIKETPALPALNKSYWGYRLREVFEEGPGKPTPAGQAISAGSSPQPNSAGVILENIKGCAGPVPPLIIKEKGSSCNFEWSNETVLVKGIDTKKGGKVGRKDGTEFKRTDNNHPSNLTMYDTIAAHFMGSQGVAAKIDKLVTGEMNGGMIYFDATKQILFPFAPPPAIKPFMPNTAKVNW